MSIRQQKLVVDQFTKQALVFASAQPIKDVEALDLLMKASGAGITDRTLDVAGKVQFGAEYYPSSVKYGGFEYHTQAPAYIKATPTIERTD